MGETRGPGDLIVAEGEVDRLRARTQALVEELERRVRRRVARVRRMLDVGSRVRAHPVAVAGVAAAVLLLAGAGIALAVARARRRRRLARSLVERWLGAAARRWRSV